jgi:hypothetical protein
MYVTYAPWTSLSSLYSAHLLNNLIIEASMSLDHISEEHERSVNRQPKRLSTAAPQPDAPEDSMGLHFEIQKDTPDQVTTLDVVQSEADADVEVEFCANCRAIEWDRLLLAARSCDESSYRERFPHHKLDQQCPCWEFYGYEDSTFRYITGYNGLLFGQTSLKDPTSMSLFTP